MINLELFSKRLKQVREDMGLSTRGLGELLGVSESTISRYENSVHEPKSQTISKLAEILKVSPVWLMGADVEKYQPINEKKAKLIPILGTIAAGQPIVAQENIIGSEYTDDDCEFCLKVKGDSMIGARIFDGDIVFIRKQDDVENGEIAAVLIDGEEATLKRVYRQNGTVILHAENPMYPDKVFTRKDFRDVKIIGKAKYVKFMAR